MHDQTHVASPEGEDCHQAVERAGVIELPDTVSSGDRLPDLLAGRFEDDDPLGAPR